jgi:hypothetical protein
MRPAVSVFTNTGLDNEAHLKEILPHSKLPPDFSETLPDFLRAEGQQREALFTVTANALGFRDPPRSKQKPSGTKRILCLGSYLTLGVGVDDEETFPRQLERMLNNGQTTGSRFEVWNGGCLSSTAIMGLARLTFEAEEYQPDLLIIEYGFVDLYCGEAAKSILLRSDGEEGPSFFMRPLLNMIRKGVSHSLLIHKIWIHRSQRHLPVNRKRWEKATHKILTWGQERNIPIVLMDQPVMSMPPEDYRRLAAAYPGTTYLCVRDAFNNDPPSEKQIGQFKRQPNWMGEFGSEHAPPIPHPSYHANLLYPNRWGHEVLARALLPLVKGRSDP